MIFRLFLFSALVMLAGCATFRYEEPTSGPRARVRFVGPWSESALTVLYSYKNANCDNESDIMRLRNGFLLSSPTKKLGIPLWMDYNENRAKEVYVTAGVPKYYVFSEGYCHVAAAIEFDEGKDYELIFEGGGDYVPPLCSVKVYEIISSEKSPPKRVPIEKHNSDPWEFSKACYDRQLRRLY